MVIISEHRKVNKCKLCSNNPQNILSFKNISVTLNNINLNWSLIVSVESTNEDIQINNYFTCLECGALAGAIHTLESLALVSLRLVSSTFFHKLAILLVASFLAEVRLELLFQRGVLAAGLEFKLELLPKASLFKLWLLTELRTPVAGFLVVSVRGKLPALPLPASFLTAGVVPDWVLFALFWDVPCFFFTVFAGDPFLERTGIPDGAEGESSFVNVP